MKEMFNNKILMRTSNNFIDTNIMSSIETEIDFKSRIFAKTLTDAVHNVANEPSLGFYRIEEHVHKSNQNLINKNYTQIELNEKVKGMSFDLDYSKDAVWKIGKSKDTFDSIYNLAADCLFKARELTVRASLLQPQMATSVTVDNISTLKSQMRNKPSQLSQQPQQQPQAAKKDASFVSGLLSSVSSATKPFRTMSISSSDVSSNDVQETKVNTSQAQRPARSQTMLLSNTIKEEDSEPSSSYSIAQTDKAGDCQTKIEEKITSTEPKENFDETATEQNQNLSSQIATNHEHEDVNLSVEIKTTHDTPMETKKLQQEQIDVIKNERDDSVNKNVDRSESTEKTLKIDSNPYDNCVKGDNNHGPKANNEELNQTFSQNDQIINSQVKASIDALIDRIESLEKDEQ